MTAADERGRVVAAAGRILDHAVGLTSSIVSHAAIAAAVAAWNLHCATKLPAAQHHQLAPQLRGMELSFQLIAGRRKRFRRNRRGNAGLRQSLTPAGRVPTKYE